MPTIKRKVDMNLSELIEWAIKKDIKDEKFYSKNGCHISIDFRGYVFLWDIRLNEIFTVETEEPITEDTVFDNLIEINELIDFKKEGLLGGVRLYKNSSINQVENDKSVAYYIMNDDLEMTLIWKRKEGMVE